MRLGNLPFGCRCRLRVHSFDDKPLLRLNVVEVRVFFVRCAIINLFLLGKVVDSEHEVALFIFVVVFLVIIVAAIIIIIIIIIIIVIGCLLESLGPLRHLRLGRLPTVLLLEHLDQLSKHVIRLSAEFTVRLCRLAQGLGPLLHILLSGISAVLFLEHIHQLAQHVCRLTVVRV